ncbi:MAG: hypothetical protein U0Z44_11615 [Kouleothrix sp.]
MERAGRGHRVHDRQPGSRDRRPALHAADRKRLLPGTLRAELLACREIAERVLTRADVARATQAWLINSVRGWVAVRLVRALEQPMGQRAERLPPRRCSRVRASAPVCYHGLRPRRPQLPSAALSRTSSRIPGQNLPSEQHRQPAEPEQRAQAFVGPAVAELAKQHHHAD